MPMWWHFEIAYELIRIHDMSDECKVLNCTNFVKIKDLCQKHYNKQYRLANKEKISNKKKEYTKANKSLKKEYDKKYRQLNREKIAKEKQQDYLNNIEHYTEYHKKYRRLNKDRLNLKRQQVYNSKLKFDPSYKLRKSISKLVKFHLESNSSSKKGSSILKYLPYSIDDLKNHIETQFEAWMTWENWGTYNADCWDDNNNKTWKWQIDHIIPQSNLPYTSMEDDNFKKCWALENLRPYSAKQNAIDGGSRIRHYG